MHSAIHIVHDTRPHVHGIDTALHLLMIVAQTHTRRSAISDPDLLLHSDSNILSVLTAGVALAHTILGLAIKIKALIISRIPRNPGHRRAAITITTVLIAPMVIDTVIDHRAPLLALTQVLHAVTPLPAFPFRKT